MWNVNQKDRGGYVSQKVELIETLWNVNDLKGFWDAFEETELIETLWNVNLNIVPIPFVNKSN